MSSLPAGLGAHPALSWVPRLTPPHWLAIVALSIVAASLPGIYMLPALAGVLIAFAILLRPEFAVYLLTLSVPLGSLAELELGDFSVTSTEALTALMVLGWALRAMNRKRVVIPLTPLTVPIAAMLLVVAASVYQATSAGLAIKETLKWLELALVYAFIVAEMATLRQAATLVAFLMVGAAIESVTGLTQFLLGLGPENFAIGRFMRAYGTFEQPNPFAGYLGMLIPVAVGVLLARPRGKVLVFFAAVTLLALAAVGASLSRGAWVGIALALSVMMAFWSRRSALLLTAGVLAFIPIGVLAFLNVLPAEVTARLATAADYFRFVDVRQEEVTSQNFAVVERVAHWQAALDMIADRPITGVGAGNYPAVYEDYMVAGWEEPLGHAHNYYLNIAAETGIPGLIVYLTIPAIAILYAGRRLAGSRAAGPSGANEPAWTGWGRSLDPRLLWRGILLGALGTLIAATTHNLFDSLFVHGMSVQLGMILALAQLSAVSLASDGPAHHSMKASS